MFSRGGSLLPSIYTDARYIDAVGVSKATAVEVGTTWMERLRATSEGGGFRKQETVGPEGQPVTEVFLGGSCNPTTWRKEIAIPMFEEHGIRYYNPQVDEWTEELTAIEGKAKEAATVQLFIVDGQTRALASILEATEYLCRGRVVVLAVQDIPPGQSILGEEVGVEELKDLNRARTYLRESATRHGVPTYANVTDACEAVCKLFSAHHEVVVHGMDEGTDTDSTLVDEDAEDANTDTFAVEDSKRSTPNNSIKEKPTPKSKTRGKPKKSFRKMSREESVITRFKVESMKLHTRESWVSVLPWLLLGPPKPKLRNQETPFILRFCSRTLRGPFSFLESQKGEGGRPACAPLNAVSCCALNFLLTRARLMTSSHSKARAKALTKSLSKITSGQFETGNTLDLAQSSVRPPPQAKARALAPAPASTQAAPPSTTAEPVALRAGFVEETAEAPQQTALSQLETPPPPPPPESI